MFKVMVAVLVVSIAGCGKKRSGGATVSEHDKLAARLVAGLADGNPEAFTSIAITLSHIEDGYGIASKRCPARYESITMDDLHKRAIRNWGSEQVLQQRKETEFEACRRNRSFEKAEVLRVAPKGMHGQCGVTMIDELVITVGVEQGEVTITVPDLSGIRGDLRTAEPIRCVDTGPGERVAFCGDSWPMDATAVVCHSGAVSDLSPLARLTRIESLDLAGTGAVDLTPIAHLTNLTRLRLERTPVTDLRPLSGLANLRELYLFQTQVSDIAPLATLENLKGLILHGTRVSDLGPLAGLSKLDGLGVASTDVADLSPLANLTEMQVLYLSRTRVTDLTPLAKLTNLFRVDLGGTKVSDLGPLAGLHGLVELTLTSTEVSDLRPLANLSALRKLDVGGTPVSESMREELQTSLPDLTISNGGFPLERR